MMGGISGPLLRINSHFGPGIRKQSRVLPGVAVRISEWLHLNEPQFPTQKLQPLDSGWRVRFAYPVPRCEQRTTWDETLTLRTPHPSHIPAGFSEPWATGIFGNLHILTGFVFLRTRVPELLTSVSCFNSTILKSLEGPFIAFN